MHPDLMLEVARQRAAERRERASNATLARAARNAARAQRESAEAPDAVVLPPIPDYVDGTFRGGENQLPAEHAGTGS